MTSEDKLLALINFPITIKQIPIDGYNINYAVAGSGEPLLLIHGGNIGWGAWYPNIAELSQHFAVYAIDLPGAGRSTRLNYRTLDPEKDFLHVVENFIKTLGLKNLNLIGCSIGGWIALQLALRHSELIHRIVVEDSVGFANHAGISDKLISFYPLALLLSKTVINPQKRGNVEKFLEQIFYNKNLVLPKEFVDYFWDTMKNSHNLLLISRLNSLHKKLNLEKQLPNILNKTLIVWGEEDEIMPLQKNIQNFNLIPQVQTSLIKQVGHMPSLEQPEKFNKIVKDFLIQNS